MTNSINENDLSIAVADKFGQLFRNMSSDWQIAKQYQCAITKTFCILNRALARSSLHVDLVSKLKTDQYTLATDGSNNSDLTKNESFDRKNS